MHHLWGKGKVVYVNPWITALIFVSAIAILLLANRDIVHGWISRVTPASRSDIRGEWVGLIDVHKDADLVSAEVNRKAAMRFNLKITSSVLGWYGGRGELIIQGEKQSRVINVVDLKPDSKNLIGPYDAGIVCDCSPDDVSGSFKGVFQPPTLAMEREEASGYKLRGVLQKGTDEDYQKLLQQMQ